MLNVEANQKILCMYFQEGRTVNGIAKELKINKRTVSRRIREHEKFRSLSKVEINADPQRALNYLKNGSSYNSDNRKPSVLTDEVIALINGFLKANEEKRLNGFRKQQLKKKDIHEALISAGYKIDYSTLCGHIRRQAVFKAETFIKQQYTEARVCEFDWCEVHLYIDGAKKRYYMAAFTSAFSNYRFAVLFVRQDTLAFQESHNQFFRHVGGAYHQMVYDNLKVAVKSFVGRDEKKPTQALVNMATWFQFRWRFCNIASGNEKGHVERTCEYVRRKSFSLVNSFSSLEEAQQQLQSALEKINAKAPATSAQSSLERFKQEKSNLHQFPGILECYEAINAKVDKYSTICCKTIHYSVPDDLTTAVVLVKVSASQLNVVFNGKVVCTHSRSYEKNTWILDLGHYLHTFRKKPGALAGSVAFNQAPQWLKDIYGQYFIQTPRTLAELLLYCRENDISKDNLQQTIRFLERHYPTSVDKDHIIALLGTHMDGDTLTTKSVPSSALFEDIVSQSSKNIMELTAMMN